jgi:uncharacterized protein YoxC
MSRTRLMAITIAPIAVILVAILIFNLLTNTERALDEARREMADTVKTL